MLAVVQMATAAGIDLETAASLVGLDIPPQAPKPAPPMAFGGPPEEEEEMKALDLRKWEAKALKSLRRFHKADVAFESNSIPFDEQMAIHAALRAAEDADAVKAAFRGDSVDALIGEHLDGAVDWAKEAMKEG